MKKLLLLLLTIYQFSYGQSLYVGVTTTVTLSSASYQGYPQPGNCWDWTISHWYNCVYATGMKLYLRVDSIVGPPNSIQITRNPDYTNFPINPNDTIIITQYSHDIYVTYLNASKLYVSLIAIGTPQIYGENYYCNFSNVSAYVSDGCGPAEIIFSGGNGSQDTIMNCTVSNLTTGIIERTTLGIKIFPNPTSDQFFIETNTTDKLNVDLFDVNGRHVFGASVMDKSNINVSSLNEGVYTMTIKTPDCVVNKKLVIIR